MLYRVLKSQHRLLDGTVLKSGETFESNDPRLIEKFPNKFEQVVALPAPVAQATTQSVGTPEAEKTDVQKAAEAGAAEILPGHQDMTTEFPVAGEAGLRVTKTRQGWYVFDEDSDEAVNEKPLKKREVAAFLEEYLA